jgi:hypothetical protein
MMKIIHLFIVIALTIGITGCGKVKDADASGQDLSSDTKKKVLYVDSYHRGYEWSDAVTEGICKTFGVTLDENDFVDISGSEVRLHILRMDTKRNASDSFKEQAALKIKLFIEKWRPDVVITSDDNAFKHIIMPYYRDADLPVVFCGLNWDASIYGAPYKNTTGMIEVALINQLVENLRRYGKGERIGYLSADVLTSRKEGQSYEKYCGLKIVERYVSNFEQWKSEFLRLQDEVDILIVGNNAGINDWREQEAEKLILQNTKIPAGTLYPWMMRYSLLGLTKSGQEQGRWAAEAALKILDGTKPSDIKIAKNVESNPFVNLAIAEKLEIILAPSILKEASVIE